MASQSVRQDSMTAESQGGSERKALALDEREMSVLREHTFASRELLALPVKIGRTYKLYLTREEADELLGYIAAESNHAKERRLGTLFNALYEKVRAFERTFVV